MPKFTDVDGVLQAELNFLEQHGFHFAGRGDGIFDPSASVSRREMVYFLARAVRANRQTESVQTAALVEKILPYVVTIKAETENGASRGTGFFVGANGLILTNAHVVLGAQKIFCEYGNYTYGLDAVKIDTAVDLAICRTKTAIQSPVVTWGDSESVLPGHLAYTVGNAMGMGITVADGIIGNPKNFAYYQLGPDQIVFVSAIKHSAPQSPGNSGGPLFNALGEVIGVSNAGVPNASNLAFAITSKVAKEFVAGFYLGTVTP